MAWFAEPPESAELLLQRADAAMYRAKAEGKHRFALWAGDETGPVVQS
jgi:PleD family two-component response regulator